MLRNNATREMLPASNTHGAVLPRSSPGNRDNLPKQIAFLSQSQYSQLWPGNRLLWSLSNENGDGVR